MRNYIVRTGDNKIRAFYHINNSGIHYRTFMGGKWKKPELLAPNTRDVFSVNISEDGSLYVFVQEYSGDIKLYIYHGDAWSNKIILKNQSPVVQPTLFSALITSNGIRFFYNTPAQEDRSQFLTVQKADANGAWSSPSRIDRFVNMPGIIYHKQDITFDHCIIFYMTKTPETNIGYREFTKEKSGAFHLAHTTGYTLYDYSFLVTDTAIHTLLLLKSMLSTQLVYRKKTSSAFSHSIVILEGQRISNCLLYIVNDGLFASFMSNGQLYTCKSYDMGNTFERPVRYKNKICQFPKKSIFMAEPGIMSNSGFYCREVYVDSENPHDIQILPELYDDFYPVGQQYHNTGKVIRVMPVSSSPLPPENMPTPEIKNHNRNIEDNNYDPFADMSFNNYKPTATNSSPLNRLQKNDTANNEYEKLRNQLSMSIQQNNEKNKQLASLMHTLKNKSEEHAKNELLLREQIDILQKELNTIKSRQYIENRYKPLDIVSKQEIQEVIEGFDAEEKNG